MSQPCAIMQRYRMTETELTRNQQLQQRRRRLKSRRDGKLQFSVGHSKFPTEEIMSVHC